MAEKKNFKVNKGITIKDTDGSSANDVNLVAKNGILQLEDNGSFTPVAEAGDNYLTSDDASFENGVGDWTGDTNIALSHLTLAPLRGSGSLRITKAAINAANESVKSPVFTVDKADLAKKIIISFDSHFNDADYSDGDFRIQIIKDPNGSPEVIRVQGEDIAAGSRTHYAQFQTDHTITEYQIELVCITTNTTELISDIDNVKVAASSIYTAPEIGEVGELLTTSWDADVAGPYLPADGTAVSRTQFAELFAAIGTTYGIGDGSTTFNLPDYQNEFLRGWTDGVRAPGSLEQDATAVNGLSADQPAHNHIEGSRKQNILGDSLYGTAGTTGSGRGEVYDTASASELQLTSTVDPAITVSSSDSETRPRNYAVKIFIRYRTDRVTSADLGGRQIATRMYLSGTQSITDINKNIVAFDAVSHDTSGMADTANNKVIIPESGLYNINSTLNISDANAGSVDNNFPTIDVNGVAIHGVYTTQIDQIRYTVNLITSKYLVKGDEITVTVNSTADSSYSISGGETASKLEVIKQASPQTILETETVAARYSTNAGQSIPNSTDTTVIYEDRDTDTHNAYNTSTGVYTIPVSGYYIVKASAFIESVPDGTGRGILSLNIDSGTENINISIVSENGYANLPLNGSTIKYLSKGQTVEVEVQHNEGTSKNLSTNGETVHFSIARIK